MKNLKQILTLTLGCFVAFVAFGQEMDDMYFNSKDRAQLNKGKITADLGLNKKSSASNEASSPINPTDSYSARNVNPEYASQLDNRNEEMVESDYFLPDFQPTGINQNISNCNCSNGSYYNPYYSNSFNDPFYNSGFGSPYGSYPSYWGNPYYSGFNSGLSLSLGYGWGSFSPGFYGGSYYSNNFWNPYSPWGNYYRPYYPQQVIIVNHGGDAGGSRVAYTKRSSRSSNINHAVNNSTRPSSVGNTTVTGRSAVSGGRSRTASPEYYERGWKRNQETNPTRGYWNNYNSGTNSNTRSDFNRGTNNGGRQGSSDFSAPSRNSFNNGGTNSGGSRSGSSGNSGGSRTRGRNN